eukprot:scaffold30583_cov132-Isochrysis_galbana.AAC.2
MMKPCCICPPGGIIPGRIICCGPPTGSAPPGRMPGCRPPGIMMPPATPCPIIPPPPPMGIMPAGYPIPGCSMPPCAPNSCPPGPIMIGRCNMTMPPGLGTPMPAGAMPIACGDPIGPCEYIMPPPIAAII